MSNQATWSRDLPETTRARMADLGHFVTLERGQTLEAHGTHDLIIVEEGEVSAEGDEPLAIGPGEIFGAAAFLDGRPQRGVAVAFTRARRIPRLELLSAIGSPRDLRAVLDAIAKVRHPTNARAWVAQLAADALSHRAVRHPYLQALGDGSLPDPMWALRDFARQYYGYSRNFPRYLTAVMSQLEDPAHRRALLENLTEESGTYSEEEYNELANVGVAREWVEGQPHPRLFLRFCRAVGADTDAPEADQVVAWRELFMATLTASAASGVGALGLGTENIVSTIYQPFVRAISRTDLSPEDTVFFPLHTAVDDHHQATLEEIAARYAETEEGRRELRRGTLQALSCRSSFWDWLLERALDPERADAVL